MQKGCFFTIFIQIKFSEQFKLHAYGSFHLSSKTIRMKVKQEFLIQTILGKVFLKFACANENMIETGLKVYRMDVRKIEAKQPNQRVKLNAKILSGLLYHTLGIVS